MVFSPLLLGIKKAPWLAPRGLCWAEFLSIDQLPSRAWVVITDDDDDDDDEAREKPIMERKT
jgi:hypothetical protein